MLGGHNPLQTFEEVFNFAQARPMPLPAATSAPRSIVAIRRRARLPPPTPPRCEFALQSSVVSKLRRDLASLGAAHWPPKLATLLVDFGFHYAPDGFALSLLRYDLNRRL